MVLPDGSPTNDREQHAREWAEVIEVVRRRFSYQAYGIDLDKELVAFGGVRQDSEVIHVPMKFLGRVYYMILDEKKMNDYIYKMESEIAERDYES